MVITRVSNNTALSLTSPLLQLDLINWARCRPTASDALQVTDSDLALTRSASLIIDSTLYTPTACCPEAARRAHSIHNLSTNMLEDSLSNSCLLLRASRREGISDGEGQRSCCSRSLRPEVEVLTGKVKFHSSHD